MISYIFFIFFFTQTKYVHIYIDNIFTIDIIINIPNSQQQQEQQLRVNN